ncbi:MAG: P-loop NTPase [Chlamydiia bacterium]|nr:P-loop NTPase [Chlamydiia bacterium]
MPLPIAKPKKNSIKKIIGIAAGKGGVGKSFVAANLARTLAQKGLLVGLLDADFYGPSLDKIFPLSKPPVLEGDVLIPAKAEGISFLSIAHFSEQMNVRAPIAAKWVHQFINKTAWGNLDYLILDFPPGTGDIPLELAQKCPLDGVILVTTPQDLALLDVEKAWGLFKSMRVPVIGIIENMSYFAAGNETFSLFGTGGGEKLSQKVQSPLIGKLPLDPEMGRLSDMGISFWLSEREKFTIFKDVFLNILSHLESFVKTKAIKSITTVGIYAFQIEWEDGKIQEFELSKLEAVCPCAGCQKDKTPILNLQAKGVTLVGDYALKVDFNEGCKKGIYPFEYLIKIGVEK